MQSGPCESKLLMVKKNCYCIYSVYLVTGTKKPDISEERTFQISKIIFFITTRGTLKDGKTQFWTLSLDSYRLPGSSAVRGG
jgi:hypothetical protein